MYATSAVVTTSVSGVDLPYRLGIETGCFRLLLARDSRPAAIEWIKRTLAIYDQAVTDSRRFDSESAYHNGFA